MISKLNTIGKWLVWLYVINMVWGFIPFLYSIGGISPAGSMGLFLAFVSATIPVIAIAFAVWHPNYPWMNKAAHVSILIFMIIMFLPNNHLLRTEYDFLLRPFGQKVAWGFSLFVINSFLSAMIGTLANIVTGIIAYYYAFKKQEGRCYVIKLR